MFRFADPQYLYLLLLLPLMVGAAYAYGIFMRRMSLRLADDALLPTLSPRRSKARRRLKFGLVVAAAGAIILMLARPQYGENTVREGKGGIEAAFMLDVSNSMLARDASPSRLERARLLISNMIDRMPSDKIALGVFAGEAYPQLPLTSDHGAARMQISSVSTSMVTLQGTNLAAAIQLGLGSFSDREVGKALVVITDGEDHLGGAEEAAKTAKQRGVTLFVLGIGTPEGATIPQGEGPLTDAEGQPVLSKLNEDMCRRVAEAGGGRYLRVDNSNRAQEAILEAFRQLPQAEQEFQHTEAGEQYQAFGIIALLFLTFAMLIFEGKIPFYTRMGLFTKKKK